MEAAVDKAGGARLVAVVACAAAGYVGSRAAMPSGGGYAAGQSPAPNPISPPIAIRQIEIKF